MSVLPNPSLETPNPSLETIVALSSGVGKAGVAVVRASGPGVRAAVTAFAGDCPPPRKAVLRCLSDPRTGEEIDRGLVLFFAAPMSFTGEDMAEFHVHGGRSVVAALLDALTACPGWRVAEPGEFTRRAVENGKFDLTAAEGIADLIDAQTAAQRRQALRHSGGHLERAVEGWRTRLMTVLALCEAAIDFPDEEDVSVSLAQIEDLCRELACEVESALQAGQAGERLREGLKAVIAGPPNVGKSTLLNALAKRDAALVSPIPGTTRDVIEIALDVAGYPLLLSDTAGLRQASDPVEQMGIARAQTELAQADMVLWLTEANEAASRPPDRSVPTLLIRSKADLAEGPPNPALLRLSAKTGEGMTRLMEWLAETAGRCLSGAESALVIRARHRLHVSEMLACLKQALVMAQENTPELMGEDLRLALRALGRLTGRVDVEDLLTSFFANFALASKNVMRITG